MKSKHLFAIVSCLVLFCSAQSFADAVAEKHKSEQTLTLDQKLSDFRQLVSRIRSGYGPLQYKKQAVGVDLDVLAPKYEQLVQATKSNGDFYYLIVRFIAEFKDGHFGARVPTRHLSNLGFSTDLVEGRIVIDKVNLEKLPKDVFEFVRGDEVVSIDGVSATDIQKNLARYVSNGYQGTIDRIAASLVSSRPGMIVPVKVGTSNVRVRRATSSVVKEVELQWQERDKPFDEWMDQPADFLLPPVVNGERHRLFGPDDLTVGDLGIEQEYRCSGTSRIERPQGATVIMETPFVAYYYPTEKGNVGYLRIPHYYPQNEKTGASEYELRFKQYEYAVSELEKNTVGLVIDQDHNCGGSVQYLHQIVSLFMDKPFKALQFRFLASKEQYLEWFDQDPKDPQWQTVEAQRYKKVSELILDSWRKGEFLTPLSSFNADQPFESNPIQYTKPIVMTIDEMSGSGGDATPAMLQGLGRVKLIGTRTMGLGGHVTDMPPLQYSQLRVRMTRSLFYRPDGTPIENRGAEPDYPYTITRDDYLYGYVPYREFYTKKLLELVK